MSTIVRWILAVVAAAAMISILCLNDCTMRGRGEPGEMVSPPAVVPRGMDADGDEVEGWYPAED